MSVNVGSADILQSLKKAVMICSGPIWELWRHLFKFSDLNRLCAQRETPFVFAIKFSLKYFEIGGSPLHTSYSSYCQDSELLSDSGIVRRIINLVFLWRIMHSRYETQSSIWRALALLPRAFFIRDIGKSWHCNILLFCDICCCMKKFKPTSIGALLERK